MSDAAQPPSRPRKPRSSQFGDGVLSSAAADEATNASLWRSVRGILVPALFGLGYAIYRLITAG